MRFPWHRKERPVPRTLADARRERVAAERRLSEARRDVIVPLRELREQDYVADAINALIMRHAGQDRS